MELKEAKHPIAKHHFTFGQRAADKLSSIVGSWVFILTLILTILAWIGFNGYVLLEVVEGKPFDPFPFILLNLVLSTLAGIQAPVILMANNRQAHKDSLRAEYDYNVDRKAEKEIEAIKSQLNRIEKKLK